MGVFSSFTLVLFWIYQLILEHVGPFHDTCFSLLQGSNWKGFQNLSASAQQDNGIKEVGKGIVSVKKTVGFVAFGNRRIKYVGLCECRLLYSDIINWISNYIFKITTAWGTVKIACVSQHGTVRTVENFFNTFNVFSLSFRSQGDEGLISLISKLPLLLFLFFFSFKCSYTHVN